MVECGDSAPDIAVVTPKYLYPNGALNEAGAIIWRDGTGMNYGRGYGRDAVPLRVPARGRLRVGGGADGAD